MASRTYLSYGPKQAPTKMRPATERAEEEQVLNSTGGYVYKINDLERLRRFLILGTEGGTYYVNERKLTKDNASCVKRCMDNSPEEAITTIVEVSQGGKAPRNDPALFALALAASHPREDCRALALSALPMVARTASHLFTFLAYCKTLRPITSSMFKKAIGDWYNDKSPQEVAYQVVKYRERAGFTHADALRLAHQPPATTEHDLIFAYALDKLTIPLESEPPVDHALRQVWGFEKAKHLQNTEADRQALIYLITDYRLTREMVPTWFLKDTEVWAALLENMPMGAMIRQLVNMSEVGLLVPMGNYARLVSNRLKDSQRVVKARIHPLQVLVAMRQYDKVGNGASEIREGLEVAFESGFGSIPKTGKKWFLALDVSGSMGTGSVAGIQGITPREATAVLAMITARNEEEYFIGGFSTLFTPLNITAKDSFKMAVNKVSGLPFGGTNLSLPFTYAAKNHIEVDVFASYTDNEVNTGAFIGDAKRYYTERMGRSFRHIVVGMTATDFSIAKPDDPNSLDIVGFDTDGPAVMAMFARGEI